MVCLLAVPLLALAVSPAAPADPKNGLAPLQGTWKLASVEINGKAVDVPQNPPRWVIRSPAGRTRKRVTMGVVTEGAPAKKAGVKKDDVLLKVGAEAATGVRQVVALVRRAAPGSELTLRVKRGGKEQDIAVKVGVLPFFFLD